MKSVRVAPFTAVAYVPRASPGCLTFSVRPEGESDRAVFRARKRRKASPAALRGVANVCSGALVAHHGPDVDAEARADAYASPGNTGPGLV